MALALFVPMAAAVIGGLVIVLSVTPHAPPFVSWGAFMAWGAGSWFGSHLRRLSWRIARHGAQPGRSWTLLAYGGLSVAFAYLVLVGTPLPTVMASLSLALQITYVGAKVQCRIRHCCAPHRFSPWADRLRAIGIPLQELQLMGSIPGIALTLVLLPVNPSIAGAAGFAWHGLMRGLDWHVRQPWRGWSSLLLDPGCGGFLVLSAYAIFVGSTTTA